MSQDQPSAEWIEELIDAISQSSLPDSKKMVYLYALSDGSFSENHFEQLSQDMAEASRDLEAQMASEQADLKEMEAELETVKAEMDQTTLDEADSYQREIEAFVEEAAQQVANEKETHIKNTL